jgi:hypothetical protein
MEMVGWFLYWSPSQWRIDGRDRWLEGGMERLMNGNDLMNFWTDCCVGGGHICLHNIYFRS